MTNASLSRPGGGVLNANTRINKLLAQLYYEGPFIRKDIFSSLKKEGQITLLYELQVISLAQLSAVHYDAEKNN